MIVEEIAYLVPQKTSQAHQGTTMSAQAVQTKEHDEEQDSVGSECDNRAESDAVQI